MCPRRRLNIFKTTENKLRSKTTVIACAFHTVSSVNFSTERVDFSAEKRNLTDNTKRVCRFAVSDHLRRLSLGESVYREYRTPRTG